MEPRTIVEWTHTWKFGHKFHRHRLYRPRRATLNRSRGRLHVTEVGLFDQPTNTRVVYPENLVVRPGEALRVNVEIEDGKVTSFTAAVVDEED
jgi:hypothetical protein